MHDDVDGRLERARARAAEKSALGARLDTLLRQIADREATLKRLDEQLAREQADVRALEGKSLSAMFATMLGTKDERLRAERADVLRATLARDSESDAIRGLRADEKPLREALWALGDTAAELESARRAKEADLVARGDAAGRRLAEIDAATADARAVSKEIDEAVAAADAAIRALDGVEDSLDSAGNWGTFDLLGGGMIATWAKHSRIDEARQKAHAAQAALDRFARELADVRQTGARGPMVVEIGSFSKFADFFFDGLIADWIVQKRISESRENVAAARRNVADVRHRLAAQIVAIRTESESLARERARLVEEE